MPKGPKRQNPAWRSSKLPKTLGESNAGTQSQSIAPSGATSAPVWQSEGKGEAADGGNGEGAAALCAADRSVTSTVIPRSRARAIDRDLREAHRRHPAP